MKTIGKNNLELIQSSSMARTIPHKEIVEIPKLQAQSFVRTLNKSQISEYSLPTSKFVSSTLIYNSKMYSVQREYFGLLDLIKLNGASKYKIYQKYQKKHKSWVPKGPQK
jgi:hypothetical protein